MLQMADRGLAMTIPAITVIIPAYGPSPHLSAVLQALGGGALQPDEIIVSHSGSDDPSDLIRQLFPHVKIIHTDERRFAGQARNVGARVAENPVLAFCDSDTIPDRDWLKNAAEALTAQPETFIVGSVGYAITGGYWGMATWIAEFSEQAPWRPGGEQNGGASCNFICLAADLNRAGYFPDEQAIGEDTLVFAKSRSNGLRQIFLPSAKVGHCNISGFRHFCKHVHGHGFASVSIRRKFNLPGSFAVRFWPISIMLWIVKIIKITRRILESGRGRFRKLGYFMPAIILAAFIWQTGAIKGLLAKS